MSIDAARTWLEQSAFHAFLGLGIADLSAQGARLRLPFDARLTNDGARLHGGVAAALAGVTGRALWLAAGGAGHAHLASLHVSYLAAAAGDLEVEARLARAGRNVCFTRTEIRATSRKPVADALGTLRLRGSLTEHRLPGPVAVAIPRPAALVDPVPPPPPAPRNVRAPFFTSLGLEVLGMGEGASCVRLPWRAELADGSGLHDGALLALLDCAGAISAHAAYGAPAALNATIALQAHVYWPDLPAADILALGHCTQRDDDVFWNEVQIAREGTGELLARGSVVYRIADRSP